MKGVINFLGKGFGFMKVDGQKPSDKDLFFHCSDIKDIHFNELSIGDTLYFKNIDDSNKGRSAKGITFFSEE